MPSTPCLPQSLNFAFLAGTVTCMKKLKNITFSPCLISNAITFFIFFSTRGLGHAFSPNMPLCGGKKGYPIAVGTFILFA